MTIADMETAIDGIRAEFSATYPDTTGASLAARLDLPLGSLRGMAIFAHCFTCTKDLLAAKRIAQRLAAQGIGVLRFDFTGLGHSGGEFGSSGFSGNVSDLQAAARWLSDHHRAPDLLIGHSLGGAAVLAAAHAIESAKGIATIGAPADPLHALKHLKIDNKPSSEDGAIEVSIGGREFSVSPKFTETFHGHDLQRTISNLNKDILILHAPLDRIVGIDNASAIFVAAKHPKSFISLDRADHLLSAPVDAQFAADMIAAWAGRLLASDENASHQGSRPVEGTVVVRPAGGETFPHLVYAGRHVVHADEPKSVGGSDSGLTPYDLLLAALGACTSMTLRMYAQRKNILLDDVVVTLRHEKRYVDDCEGCEDKPVKIDVIAREIALPAGLDEAQRARLMEIADKCPVHRTLEGELRIETSVAPG